MPFSQNILIIEPNRVVGFDLKLKLKSNYNMYSAFDLKSTLQILKDVIPDLIIADTSIKEDISQFKRIIKIWRGNKIPVIYISSSNLENISKEPNLEVIGAFSKPFDSENIADLINKYFSAT